MQLTGPLLESAHGTFLITLRAKKSPQWKYLGSLMSQPSVMLLIELDHLSASQYFP